eukprot:scaffold129544_cov44-Attheya_sp.AAC.2
MDKLTARLRSKTTPGHVFNLEKSSFQHFITLQKATFIDLSHTNPYTISALPEWGEILTN